MPRLFRLLLALTGVRVWIRRTGLHARVAERPAL